MHHDSPPFVRDSNRGDAAYGRDFSMASFNRSPRPLAEQSPIGFRSNAAQRATDDGDSSIVDGASDDGRGKGMEAEERVVAEEESTDSMAEDKDVDAEEEEEEVDSVEDIDVNADAEQAEEEEEEEEAIGGGGSCSSSKYRSSAFGSGRPG